MIQIKFKGHKKHISDVVQNSQKFSKDSSAFCFLQHSIPHAEAPAEAPADAPAEAPAETPGEESSPEENTDINLYCRNQMTRDYKQD